MSVSAVEIIYHTNIFPSKEGRKEWQDDTIYSARKATGKSKGKNSI